MNNLTLKQKLVEYLRPLAAGGFCVAFSGGVDSAVLLAACRSLTENVHAITVRTPLHQKAESAEAAALAEVIGCRHMVLHIAEIPESVAKNTPERCYLCKHEIFTSIKAYAAENNLATVVDGTNLDDMSEYRPGRRALAELEITSPLRQCGLTKQQVREIAEEYGLSVARKPSTPCLATRFPYYAELLPELLEKAGELEEFMQKHGFEIVRARIHGNIVRLELPPDRFDEAIQKYGEIVVACKSCGFDYVTLDLEGFRSGSMDILPEQKAGNLI